MTSTDHTFVAYVRLSRHEQQSGKGRQEQRAAIINAALETWPIHQIRWYQDVFTGREGSASQREQLQKALDVVSELGENCTLITRHVARICRSGGNDAVTILNTIVNSGCGFIAVQDGVNSWKQDQSEWVQGFLDAARKAAHYSENLSQKTKDRARQAKAKGQHWARLPYGYRKDADGTPVPDDVEYPIVLEIVRRIDSGETCYAVTKDLNRRRIRTKTGKLWHEKTVWNVYQYQKSPGVIQASKQRPKWATRPQPTRRRLTHSAEL